MRKIVLLVIAFFIFVGATTVSTKHLIDSSGVSIDSDDDGMLIIQGNGNGNDEDLRINLDDGVSGANTVEITSGTSVNKFDFTNIGITVSGANIIGDSVIAYKSGSQPYVYAYDTTLTKYIQMYHTGTYGILNTNSDMIISASAPSTNNIIFQNIMAQANIATTGTTPASIWFSQSSTSGLGAGAHSMFQQDIDKDQTSWLVSNGLFQDITADFALGTHINQAAASNKSTGLVLGIHGTNQVGQFNAIDSTNSWAERTFVYGTGSNNLFEVNINRLFDATDPSAAGSSSGTSYTGHVWSLKDNGTEKAYIDYTGSVVSTTKQLTPQASAPGSPTSGLMYVDSTPTPDELCFYDGAAWQGISSGTDANCA